MQAANDFPIIFLSYFYIGFQVLRVFEIFQLFDDFITQVKGS